MTGSMKTYEEAISRGFIQIREYNPWGFNPCFRNFETGELLFDDNGELICPQEMHRRLKEDWIPQAQREVLWKLDFMGSYFSEYLKEKGD